MLIMLPVADDALEKHEAELVGPSTLLGFYYYAHMGLISSQNPAMQEEPNSLVPRKNKSHVKI